MGLLKLKELFEKTPRVSVRFRNLTSETEIAIDVELSSISHEGCVLLLPKASCSQGHQILLFLTPDKQKKKKKIEIMGKVQEVHLLNEATIEVRLLFNQFVKEELQSILAGFEQKQNLITKVLETLKTPKP